MRYTIYAKDSFGMIVFERQVIDDADAEYFLQMWERDGFTVQCLPEFLEDKDEA